MPKTAEIHHTESKGSSQLPLILIHGAGGTHLHWPPQLRHLNDWRVIAIDLPAHGESGGARCASIAEFAQAIIAFLDALDIQKAIIAGHSMGGAITQTLALDYPDRIAGAILVGTGARLRVAPQILNGIKTDFAGTVKLSVDWSFGPTTPETIKRLAHQRMLEVNPDVLLSDYAACNAFDVMERVAQIAAPTLVLVGTADKMTPEKYSRYLVEKIAGAQLRVFPDAGHMLMLERAEEVTQAIREFVRFVADRSSGG